MPGPTDTAEFGVNDIVLSNDVGDERAHADEPTADADKTSERTGRRSAEDALEIVKRSSRGCRLICDDAGNRQDRPYDSRRGRERMKAMT